MKIKNTDALIPFLFIKLKITPSSFRTVPINAQIPPVILNFRAGRVLT